MSLPISRFSLPIAVRVSELTPVPNRSLQPTAPHSIFTGFVRLTRRRNRAWHAVCAEPKAAHRAPVTVPACSFPRLLISPFRALQLSFSVRPLARVALGTPCQRAIAFARTSLDYFSTGRLKVPRLHSPLFLRPP